MAVKGIQRPDDLVKRKRAYLGFDRFVGMIDHRLDLLFANLRFDVRDKADDLFNLFVCKEDRVEHLLFGDLVGACFDHHDRVLCAGNGEA